MTNENTAKISLVARCSCGYVFNHLVYTHHTEEIKDGDVVLAKIPIGSFSPSRCPSCHKEIKNITTRSIANSEDYQVDFGYCRNDK